MTTEAMKAQGGKHEVINFAHPPLTDLDHFRDATKMIIHLIACGMVA